MLVVKRVENRFSAFAEFDQMRVFENSELMGNCRHTHREFFGDVANAHLALKEKVKDLYARAVSHNRKELGKIEKMLIVGQGDLIDNIVMRFVLSA
jgi:hypothetical protein